MKKLLLLLMIVSMISFGQNKSNVASSESLSKEISQEMLSDGFTGKGTFDDYPFKYVGEWVNGRKHGQGTETYDWGTEDDPVGFAIMYVGEWRRGQYLLGTVTYDNGDKYVGEFKANIEHGKGTYTYADGKVKKGLWEMGEFIGKE